MRFLKITTESKLEKFLIIFVANLMLFKILFTNFLKLLITNSLNHFTMPAVNFFDPFQAKKFKVDVKSTTKSSIS